MSHASRNNNKHQTISSILMCSAGIKFRHKGSQEEMVYSVTLLTGRHYTRHYKEHLEPNMATADQNTCQIFSLKWIYLNFLCHCTDPTGLSAKGSVFLFIPDELGNHVENSLICLDLKPSYLDPSEVRATSGANLGRPPFFVNFGPSEVHWTSGTTQVGHYFWYFVFPLLLSHPRT